MTEVERWGKGNEVGQERSLFGALLEEKGEKDRRFRDEERRACFARDKVKECKEGMRWRLRVDDEEVENVRDEE